MKVYKTERKRFNQGSRDGTMDLKFIFLAGLDFGYFPILANFLVKIGNLIFK